MSSANYIIKPFLKTGFGRSLFLRNDDTSLHASTEVTFHFGQGDTRLSKKMNISLMGPGEVSSVASYEISRIYPQEGVPNVESNYFPLVEFYKPDLPWIFSPEEGTIDRIKPWLALIVLETEEFERTKRITGTARPSIRVRSQQSLPNLNESWAWAHVQIEGFQENEIVEKIISNDPYRVRSRILSTRHLLIDKSYTAFLVPCYYRGVLKGLHRLHLQSASVPAIQPGWDHTSSEGIELPYYFSWEFSTGTPEGDFETLVKSLLPPIPLPSSVGYKEMDVQNLGFSLPQTTSKSPPTFFMKGALISPAAKIKLSSIEGSAVLTPEFSNDFISLLNQSSIVVDLDDNERVLPIGPPLYGKWHAAKQQITPNVQDTSWFEELNLDLTMRAAAGLGTKVIMKNQEELMAAAWDQVDGLNLLNQQLRQSQLSLEITRCIHNKHLKNLGEEDLFSLTREVHSAIDLDDNTSLSEYFNESLVPTAIFKSGFAKLTRKSGAVFKKMKLQQLPEQKLKAPITRFHENELKIAGSIHGSINRPPKNRIPISDTDLTTLPDTPSIFQTFKNKILQKLHPQNIVFNSTANRINIPNWSTWNDLPSIPDLEPIMAHPVISHPMYVELRNISPELLLPGVAEIKNNTVSLLETNQKFIEAFMVGLNHEMSRELLWREFPTDQRGTYFNQFWSSELYNNHQGEIHNESQLKDIVPINEWGNNPLGKNRPILYSENNSIVLLIRGDLLFRYPRTIIYAQRAKLRVGEGVAGKRTFQAEKRYPIFHGFIPPDIRFLGFNLSSDEVRGREDSTEDDQQGWFFVFKENSTEPRFGLDINEDHFGQPITTWNNLSWNHLVSDREELNNLKYMEFSAVLQNLQINRQGSSAPAWNSNSADLAAISFQKPFLNAIHGSDMLPE